MWKLGDPITTISWSKADFGSPKQPRRPKGSPQGGEFAPKGGGGPGGSDIKAELAKTQARWEAANDELADTEDKIAALKEEYKKTSKAVDKRKLKEEINTLSVQSEQQRAEVRDIEDRWRELKAEAKSPSARAVMNVVGSADSLSLLASDYRKEMGAGARKLSDVEVVAVVAYTDKWGTINGALRKQVGNEDLKQYTAVLDNVINKKGKAVGTVFRGVGTASEKEFSQFVKMYQPGTVVKDKGFVSTSKDTKFPKEWVSRVSGRIATYKVNYKIKGARGLDMDFHQPAVKEVLLRSGSMFKVESAELKGKSLDVVLKHIR